MPWYSPCTTLWTTLSANLSEVLNVSILFIDWNYGSLHTFMCNDLHNTTSFHYIHHFSIYSDYCIFTISRLSQWNEINVLYLCFICYCICCQLHTQSSHLRHCTVIKSVTVMCRSTFRGKKPLLIKIQYVDVCKRECIMYQQRCRNYNKLLVVPTDSPYSIRNKMAHFLMSSSFCFTHINESTNQIVVILCCTIRQGNGKFTAPATRLYRGMK